MPELHCEADYCIVDSNNDTWLFIGYLLNELWCFTTRQPPDLRMALVQCQLSKRNAELCNTRVDDFN